jgi:hypothetical protein
MASSSNVVVARVYQLTIQGEMGLALRAEFSDLQANVDDGQTVLTGELPDQAALYSVLDRLQSLGLDLVHVNVIEPEQTRPSLRDD